MKHGVIVTKQATSVVTPVAANTGLPIFFGTAPVQSAEKPAKAGIPVLCTSWAEAVEHLGYSDNWEKYTLCEAMYCHFKLYGCQPAIFCNVLDVSQTEVKEAEDMSTADHKVKLPIEAVASTVVVNTQEKSPLVLDTDYALYYENDALIIELLKDSDSYGAAQLNVAYSKVNQVVTSSEIATALEAVDQCMSLFGLTPDLLCAPGWSHESALAAAMATKAESINGLFKAKALIDIDTTTATDYTGAVSAKGKANLNDPAQVDCWPMFTLGDKKFHGSTQLAGLMASVDTDNGGIPYESPSNKGLKCDGLCLADGTEVILTYQQANVLNMNGIVTGLNFITGWVAWGNYTGAYPASSDVVDYMLPVSRMFDFVNNTLVRTFWCKLDKPMNRRLIDTILDSANIWLNGLVGQGYILGARVVMNEEENPLANLMAGIIKLHVYMTPPSPAQEIDFVLEYDANYVTSALMA